MNVRVLRIIAALVGSTIIFAALTGQLLLVIILSVISGMLSLIYDIAQLIEEQKKRRKISAVQKQT